MVKHSAADFAENKADKFSTFSEPTTYQHLEN